MNFEEFSSQFPVGKKLKCVVVTKRDFGVFVNFGIPDLLGIIQVDQFPGFPGIILPEEGAELEAWVFIVQELPAQRGHKVMLTMIDPADQTAERMCRDEHAKKRMSSSLKWMILKPGTNRDENSEES